MTQEERLDYLVEAFKADSIEYSDIKTPEDTEGKRCLLRSLMNIRMPKELPAEVLAVQDEYLQERAREKGIVEISDIPEACKGIAIWQGDITRLAADAIVNAANAGLSIRIRCGVFHIFEESHKSGASSRFGIPSLAA